MNQQIIEKVRERFVQDDIEILGDGRGICNLKFREDGTFEKNNWELVKWEVHLIKEYKLYLYTERSLIAVLNLRETGEWKGRSRDTNGRIILLAKSNIAAWRLISNPGKYFKHLLNTMEEISIPIAEKTINLAEHYPKYVVGAVDTAIGIIGCDRPFYFRRVVESLSKNKDIDKYPIFVFLDECGDKSATAEHAKLIEQYLPWTNIIYRSLNYGCGRNIIDARRQLFDNLEYPKVFILEDDMEVSTSYIAFTLKLLEWGRKNFHNIGAAQGWNFCRLSKKVKEKNWNSVIPTLTNWWGYVMIKECWDSIKDDMYLYENLFLMDGEYHTRKHDSIKTWFKLKFEKGRKKLGEKLFANYDTGELQEQFKRYFASPPTGQDAATMHLFYLAGWDRLAPVVNRGLYIGQQGIHMNPSMWTRHGFSEVDLYVRNYDNLLAKFTSETDISNIDSPIPGFAYIRN